MSYLKYEDKIKSMSDEELKEETYALHEAVRIVECFGPKDIARLEACKVELLNRGYDLIEKPILNIEK